LPTLASTQSTDLAQQVVGHFHVHRADASIDATQEGFGVLEQHCGAWAPRPWMPATAQAATNQVKTLAQARANCTAIYKSLMKLVPPLSEDLQLHIVAKAHLVEQARTPNVCLAHLGEYLAAVDVALSRSVPARRLGRSVFAAWKRTSIVHDDVGLHNYSAIFGPGIEHFQGCAHTDDGEKGAVGHPASCACAGVQTSKEDRLDRYAERSVKGKRGVAWRMHDTGRETIRSPRHLSPRLPASGQERYEWDSQGPEDFSTAVAPTMTYTPISHKLKPEHVPPELVCPINGQVFRDPVVAADGYTYERKAIERWCAKHSQSPVTSQTLSHLNLVPSHMSRSMLHRIAATARRGSRPHPRLRADLALTRNRTAGECEDGRTKQVLHPSRSEDWFARALFSMCSFESS
jgi:hypothetical protein